MRGHLTLIERGSLGSAYDPVTGDTWHVIYAKYNQSVPNSYPESDTEFVCERVHAGNVIESVGFFTEQQCFEWLSGGEHYEFERGSPHGDSETVKRPGRGIPDGLIRKNKAKLTTPFAPSEVVVSAPILPVHPGDEEATTNANDPSRNPGEPSQPAQPSFDVPQPGEETETDLGLRGGTPPKQGTKKK